VSLASRWQLASSRHNRKSNFGRDYDQLFIENGPTSGNNSYQPERLAICTSAAKEKHDLRLDWPLVIQPERGKTGSLDRNSVLPSPAYLIACRVMVGFALRTTKHRSFLCIQHGGRFSLRDQPHANRRRRRRAARQEPGW
jgi:hypothetical protein